LKGLGHAFEFQRKLRLTLVCENQQIDLPTMGRSISPIWADNNLWISENTSSENTLPPPNLLLQQSRIEKQKKRKKVINLVNFNLNYRLIIHK
jgi:hypothetical protein